MPKIILALLFLASCASFTGTKESGGEERYVYDNSIDYTSEELVQIAPGIVKTSFREPPTGKFADLFNKNQKPIKRIGIIVFETMIQPTVDGLAGMDKVYVSAAGKQLITEKFLSIWNQSFPILGQDFDYVSIPKIKKAKTLHEYGVLVKDHVNSNRSALDPDDVSYIPKGKITTSSTVLNAREMQDVSFVLVPAAELMQGPKFSEHNKHFANDLARELKLDAVIIVMSRVSWTAARMEKNTGVTVPEDLNIQIKSSTLIPIHEYYERLTKAGLNGNQANITMCFRSYEGSLNFPILLSVDPEQENFKTIETEILDPMMKAYKNLAQITIVRMLQDMRTTY
jgi:hypothetical protein